MISSRTSSLASTLRDRAFDHPLLVERRNEHADERLGIDRRTPSAQILPRLEQDARPIRTNARAMPSVIAIANRKPSARDAEPKRCRTGRDRRAAARWSRTREAAASPDVGRQTGELRYGNETVTPSAKRIDDDRQRGDRLAPVAARIVKQHDVAAALRVRLIVAAQRVRSAPVHDVVHDRLDAGPLPILAVDVQAHRDVAAVLRLPHGHDLVGSASALHRRRMAHGTV